MSLQHHTPSQYQSRQMRLRAAMHTTRAHICIVDSISIGRTSDAEACMLQRRLGAGHVPAKAALAKQHVA